MNNKTSTPNPMMFLYYLTSELWHSLMQHKLMTSVGMLCAIFLKIHFIDSIVAAVPFHYFIVAFSCLIKGFIGAFGVMLFKNRTIYYEWIRAKARYHYSKIFNKK